MSEPREAGGPWVWLDKLSVDADGSRNSYGDPYWQKTTSLSDGHAHYVDADQVPYLAIGPDVGKAMGAKLGDLGYAVNITNGASTPFIWADVAPRGHHWEMSMEAAGRLGLSRSPTSGGTSRQVIAYCLFPGSGSGWPLDGWESTAGTLFEGWGGVSALQAALRINSSGGDSSDEKQDKGDQTTESGWFADHRVELGIAVLLAAAAGVAWSVS